MVLSRVRLIRVRIVLVNLNQINDTYIIDSYTEPKNPFAIGRNSARLFYHTDLSRFVTHNLLDMPRFQNFPEWIQNEKVAETCKFDGKEPLFVERTIAISLRVLG